MNEVLERLLDGLAAGFEGDADAAAEVFAEDAMFRDRPDEPLLRGRDAILGHFLAYGGRRERFRRGDVLVDGDRAAVEYEVAFRADASAYGQRGVALITVRDGQIADWRGVWVETPSDLDRWSGD